MCDEDNWVPQDEKVTSCVCSTSILKMYAFIYLLSQNTSLSVRFIYKFALAQLLRELVSPPEDLDMVQQLQF